MRTISRRLIPILILLAVITLMGLGSSPAMSQEDTLIEYVHAKVLKILPETYNQDDIPALESDKTYQYVEVEILNGEHKGETIVVQNVISDNLAYNIEVNRGDEVLLYLEKDKKGSISNAYVSEIVRQKYLLYLTFAFFSFLVLIGGSKGLKAILTLFLTGFAVIKILLPLMLKGYSPVLLSIGISAGVIIITLLILTGINKKTFSAIIGTTGGVLVAGIIALVVGSLAKLTGLGDQDAQMLMFIPQAVDFDFRGLLFAGIIIGALGAVMDVGMSVASAMYEIEKTSPGIKTRDLIKSGMNVGRDIMGTMSNTLILAYAGSSMHLMLLFLAHEMPFTQIINWDMIASEVVRAMAGSIGLIFTIPITAIAAGTIGRRKKSAF